MSHARTSPLKKWIRKPVVCVSLGVLTILLLIATTFPLWWPHHYDTTSDAQFASPSWNHPFGTDLHGRDLFSRTFLGLTISLIVGAVGTSVCLVIGVTYGMISGYVGGKVDLVLMRMVDILYSLPRLVFVIVLIGMKLETRIQWITEKVGIPIQPDVGRMILLFIGLGALEWLTMSRIIRGQVLSLKEQPFVLAARALGASHWRILRKHILPNLMGIIIIYLTLTIPSIILLESMLSFLGLGIQPPMASLGTLTSEGAAAINPIEFYWWLLTFPSLIMAAVLLSLNVLGDHLRDILDPKLSRKR